MNCCVGVSASSSLFARDDPAASVETSRNSRNRRVDGPRRCSSVHVDITRPEKSSDVEQQRPRSAAALRKSSSTCRNKITTQLNSTTSDNVLPVDFNSRVQPNCLGRFVVHASQRTRKRQLRKHAWRKMGPSSIYRVAV